MPPVNAAEDQVVTLAVLAEMTCIHETKNIPFSFASGFAEVMLTVASVDVVYQTFPTSGLALTDRIT
ncbi:hypothetical protein RBE51_17095 [Pseudomonas taiwanensis]|uniref:hypothetical protein n=1 Tax=Pseudomonas taiwanensis TaxID=470150 RepID=UPI0028E09E9F|nr:hypothetical protein [Pseudomonas taiwanensis]MDT8924525.1 hypothetical protein [Pseudomonas taiwanensis]